MASNLLILLLHKRNAAARRALVGCRRGEMVTDRPNMPNGKEGKSAALRLAEEIRDHPYAAAAIAGGAAALAGGAFVGARALARRNGARPDRPLNQILQTAITACEAKAVPKDG
jgi:hypothetical protein